MNKEDAIKDVQDAMNLLYDTIHPLPKTAILNKLSKIKLFLESEAGIKNPKWIQELEAENKELKDSVTGHRKNSNFLAKRIDTLQTDIQCLTAERDQYFEDYHDLQEKLKAKDELLKRIYKNSIGRNVYIEGIKDREALKGGD